MSARNFAQAIGAGETITLPAGRYFFIRTATAALDVRAQGNRGAPMDFIGITVGSQFGPVPEDQKWGLLRVTSAVAQNIEIVISDDAEFKVANAVTVTGTALIAEQPASGHTTTAPANVTTGNAATIAANLSRKRLTICAPHTNTDMLYVQTAGGGAQAGMPLAPATFVEVRNTAAVDVRNDSGATQQYSVFEET